MGRVQDKVAIVTGGAVGLGQACAELLAMEGAKVMLTDINRTEGERTAEAIRSRGGEARFLEHDVAEEDDWRRVVQECKDRHGRVDVLVNNAGVGIGCPPDEQTLEKWRWLMSINLDGVFLGTKHVLIAMKEQQPSGGSIVNLSSIEGIVGDPNLGAYNASKGGVRLYTKSVALYAAKAGLNVRVNSVHPGYIWTPMVENYLAAHGDVAEGRRAIDALHPIGHIGEPSDIAYGVLYLGSDEAKFVTGSELVIDGGYTAQ